MSEYSVEEIIRAKRVARENGYTVNMPKDEIEQAMNIAKSAGYTVKEQPVAKPATSTKPTETQTTKAQPRPSVYDVAAKYL